MVLIRLLLFRLNLFIVRVIGSERLSKCYKKWDSRCALGDRLDEVEAKLKSLPILNIQTFKNVSFVRR